MSRRCPKCGYDLTGLTANRCPECGSAFDPVSLARQQSIRRPRWWVALIAVLASAYAPFATWIPWADQAIWLKLWPIMPGFFFGALIHPSEPTEFIIMGVATTIILIGATCFASRRWWMLVAVVCLLLLWTSFNAWGGYAAMRM